MFGFHGFRTQRTAGSNTEQIWRLRHALSGCDAVVIDAYLHR